MTKKLIKTQGVKKPTNFANFLSQKIPFLNFVYAAVIINSINLLIVFAFQKNLPPQVPLFYGHTEGEQQLTSSLGLLIPGAYSLVLTVINTVLSIFLGNDYLKKVLIIASFTISLLSIITITKIILLVGYF